MSVQSIIKNWIEINNKYNSKNWNFDTTAKRELYHGYQIHKLTYEESNEQYKKDFNQIIQKQTLHLIKSNR